MEKHTFPESLFAVLINFTQLYSHDLSYRQRLVFPIAITRQASHICPFFIIFAVVMKSDGFGCLEETCPSLLSELLETVAVVDEEDTSLMNRKRSSSSNIGLDIVDGLDSNLRRMRRRL